MFDQFHSKSEIRKQLCFDIHMAPVVKLSKSGWLEIKSTLWDVVSKKTCLFL